ncbi:hypothetical protein OUZ56_010672 [Daphnia magna]|uniref:Uncharacterized protein n=1 Tax=Daphnia magna TaxID=35525 RepID=A0ABR0AJ85_9CRUS|nr:hypothetical protein OUZ56_010672 [Daphnia magna]
MIGGNFKGYATAVSQAFEKILQTGIAYNSIYGNTILSRESEKEYALIQKLQPSSQSCTAAFLAGYTTRVLVEQEFCVDCIARFQRTKSFDSLMQLIYRLDPGELLYPTDEYVSRIWTVYFFIKEILSQISKSTFLLKGLFGFLLSHIETYSTFVCEVARPGENNKDLIMIILKKFLKPILANKKKLHSILNKTRNSFHPANKERRARTLIP